MAKKKKKNQGFTMRKLLACKYHADFSLSLEENVSVVCGEKEKAFHLYRCSYKLQKLGELKSKVSKSI